MPIFDCILYNGEKDLLDIRLRETCLFDDWVQTVIVEANKTHTFFDKPLYFEQHKSEFKTFNIMYLAVTDLPENATARERETFQRNKIKDALRFLCPKGDDIVLVSDVDEVPRSAQINKFLKNPVEFAALIQNKYAYYLNNLESEQSWDRSRLMKWSYLKDKTPEEVRNSGYDFSLHHAGWHWSWVIDPVKKLESFSHVELNTIPNLERVSNKENIWNDDEFKIVDIDLFFPRYLYEHQEKFKHLIKQ